MRKLSADNPLPRALTSWRPLAERSFDLSTQPVSPKVRDVHARLNNGNIFFGQAPDGENPQVNASFKVRRLTRRGAQRAYERANRAYHSRINEDAVIIDEDPRTIWRERLALMTGRRISSLLDGRVDVAVTLPTTPREVGDEVKVTALTGAGDITASGIQASRLTLAAPHGKITTTDTRSFIKAWAGDNVTIRGNTGSVYVETPGIVVVDSIKGDVVHVEGGQRDVVVDNVTSPILRVDTTDGGQYVRNFTGDADLFTVNGNIQVDGIDGSVAAENTRSRMRFTDATLTRESRFTTVGGSVAVSLSTPDPDLKLSMVPPDAASDALVACDDSSFEFYGNPNKRTTLIYTPPANQQQ